MAGFSATVLTIVALLIAVAAIVGYLRLMAGQARELAAKPRPPSPAEVGDQAAVLRRRSDEPTTLIKRNQE